MERVKTMPFFNSNHNVKEAVPSGNAVEVIAVFSPEGNFKPGIIRIVQEDKSISTIRIHGINYTREYESYRLFNCSVYHFNRMINITIKYYYMLRTWYLIT